MSLLTALLRDSLLDTVMQQDVWIAIRTDGPSTGAAPGAGTEGNPYNGYGNYDASTTRFDWIMQNKVSAGNTVRLGPTTSTKYYTTRGYSWAGDAGTGWTPKDGIRILGSGMDSCTLKVIGAPVSEETVAIGNNPTSDDDFLEIGLEVQDLTIDADLSGQATSCSVGGISVAGTRVSLRRVRVKNFGTKTTSLRCLVLSVRCKNATPPKIPNGCVIDACEVVEPSVSTATSGEVVGLHIGYETTGSDQPPLYHEACVVRNCVVNGAISGAANFAKNIIGIAISGGKGTIVEGNRIWHCLIGGPHLKTPRTTPFGLYDFPNVDLVVRDNYYFNVRTGIEQEFATDAGSTWKNGRVIVLRNIMQLDTTAAAMGIQLKGKTSGDYGHQQVVIRRNIMRPRDDATPFSGTKGIVVENGEEVLVENNVIELDDPNAVRHTAVSSAKFKAFNNQKVNGTLLPGYNTGTSTHDGELAIDVDDVVLGL